MSKTFTVAEEALIAKASEDLLRYEKICEDHSAILRKDPEECSKAYAADSSNPGIMWPPSRSEYDHCIEESEKVLEKKCESLLDHLHVVQNATFLCGLLTNKLSDQGERVCQEFIRRKAQLEYPSQLEKHPYIFSESDLLVATHVDSELEEVEYPITLPARAFNREDVINLPRVPLQKADIIRYERNPELLSKETFVSFNKDEEEYEAFRIPAFITADQEKLFYVVYADGGPEGVAFASTYLFELLETSEIVQAVN